MPAASGWGRPCGKENGAGEAARPCKLNLNLLHDEGFDHVALLDIAVLFDPDAARPTKSPILRANGCAPLRGVLVRHYTSICSIMKASITSPSLISLYFSIPMPHS